MIGDDAEDYLARTSVKLLHKLGLNVMTMSPAKKDYGDHNYPLERIEKAIRWLKTSGRKAGDQEEIIYVDIHLSDSKKIRESRPYTQLRRKELYQ